MAYPRVNRSHIVPKAYLRNFADDDQIGLRLVGEAASTTVSIDDAGVRRRYYRRTRQDGTPIDDIEWSLSHIEGAVVPLLREVEDRWPLTHRDKGTLAEFFGVQLVRGPRWMAWWKDRTTNWVADQPDQSDADELEAALLGDTNRLTQMLSVATKVGTALGSMHWALLTFRADLLASSDHPVVAWPLSYERALEPSAVGWHEGLLNILEARVALSPRLALLMTWVDDPDPQAPIVAGARQHAQNLNAFTVKNAERQWFHKPGTSPPRGSGKLLPLGPQVFARYSPEAALQSRRRAKASELINAAVGSDLEDRDFEIVWIS